jgi:hypothetical protein
MSNIPLYCPCPAIDCPNPNKSPVYWPHAGCGGKTQLNYYDITIRCPWCGVSGVMTDWLFKCSMHNYRKASTQGCINAIVMLTQNPCADQLAIQRAILKVTLQWNP